MLLLLAMALNACVAVLVYLDVSRSTAREWKPLGVAALVFFAGLAITRIDIRPEQVWMWNSAQPHTRIAGGGVYASIAISLLVIAFRVVNGAFPLPQNTCSSCGGRNPLEAKVCQHCGGQESAQVKKSCGVCRKVFSSSAGYCPFCAVPLLDYKPTEPKPREMGHVVACPQCGASNMSKREECHKCGRNLRSNGLPG